MSHRLNLPADIEAAIDGAAARARSAFCAAAAAWRPLPAGTPLCGAELNWQWSKHVGERMTWPAAEEKHAEATARGGNPPPALQARLNKTWIETRADGDLPSIKDTAYIAIYEDLPMELRPREYYIFTARPNQDLQRGVGLITLARSHGKEKTIFLAPKSKASYRRTTTAGTKFIVITRTAENTAASTCPIKPFITIFTTDRAKSRAAAGDAGWAKIGSLFAEFLAVAEHAENGLTVPWPNL